MVDIAKTWSVSQLQCYSEASGEQDVVSTIEWLLTGTDGEYAATVRGLVDVPTSPSASFTPYADLTETQVVGWVQDAFGAEQVAAYEANLAVQIESAKNPPVVNPPLPWG